jgi:TRAP-type C4-dicarboxylate transport system substrate-binding protein
VTHKLLAACLLLALSHTALAVTTLKIATVAPDGTTWMQELRKSGEEIARRTEGRVKLRYFPGGVMGNDNSVLRKIRIGQLQGGVIISGGLTEIYPDIDIYNVPFIFRSYEEADYVRERMDPVLIKGLAEHGFVSFGLSEGGFAYLMSNQPIHSIDELKGHKVWVPEGDLISRIVFEAIDVTPIPLPLTDVLTGLQTGLIDTVAGSAIGAIALQWHTQVKYLVDEPLVYLYATLIIDNKAFDRISTADQTVVREVMEASFRKLNQQTRQDDAAARQALKAQGIVFVEPSADSRRREDEIRSEAEKRLLQQHILSPELLQSLHDNINAARKAPLGHQ